jgi:hypothetical protein
MNVLKNILVAQNIAKESVNSFVLFHKGTPLLFTDSNKILGNVKIDNNSVIQILRTVLD